VVYTSTIALIDIGCMLANVRWMFTSKTISHSRENIDMC